MRPSALSNHVPVPSPEDVRVPRPETNGHAGTDAIEEGVLSNLPRSRPQRTTERRIASREGRRPGGQAPKDGSNASAKANGAAAKVTGAKGTDASAKGARAKPKGAAKAKSADGTAKTSSAHGAAKTRSADAAAHGTSGPSPNGAGATPKRTTRAASPRKPRKSAKPRAAAAPKRVPPKPADSAPRQGFESETSRSSTGPVQPPGGAELVAGAVEIVGEVAKAGLSAGERVLKDLFSRLPH